MAADEEAAELVSAASDRHHLEGMVARRMTGEPLAWITGSTQFCGLEVTVRPGVYVPRWQSETLARTAANLLPSDGVAVDLCTGSGAVALLLQTTRPEAQVVATDLDPPSVACARENGVDALLGDLGDALPPSLAGQVDVMTGVLPYVPTDGLHHLPRDIVDFEPRGALDGGSDGLDLIRRAIASSVRWIRPGGWLLLEVGGDQFEAVEQLFGAAGFEAIEVLSDGDGDPRAVSGRLGTAPAGVAST
ncbi:MAG: HemK/PrmC family methyltransferase [Acidimicrobiales bacterium]